MKNHPGLARKGPPGSPGLARDWQVFVAEIMAWRIEGEGAVRGGVHRQSWRRLSGAENLHRSTKGTRLHGPAGTGSAFIALWLLGWYKITSYSARNHIKIDSHVIFHTESDYFAHFCLDTAIRSCLRTLHRIDDLNASAPCLSVYSPASRYFVWKRPSRKRRRLCRRGVPASIACCL